METPPVLVLELNELAPPLVRRFIADGQLPNFARLRERSATFVTEAGEDQGHLNPWIQWVTAHAGVPYEEHRVFKLGEGAGLRHPTVADVVGRAGRTVWLCGPMNVVPVEPVRGAWLPDPWNPSHPTQPTALEPFARFVRAHVQEHTNPSHRSTVRDGAAFLRFMAGHGLSPTTVRAAVAQLAGERTGRRERWRRAALLDRFQWDVFTWYWRRERPAFATFFSNTTAHYQHLYWRHMDPDAFERRPDPEELERFRDAVAFGYREMDRLVGQALDLVGDEATLVFCTALSQQPYLLGEDGDGVRFHRPHDIRQLLDRLGVEDVVDVAPVMSGQFHVYFADDASAMEGERVLASSSVEGRALLASRRVGSDILTGCARTDAVAEDAQVVVAANGRSAPFGSLFYRSETAKSGYHHPDGLLWIKGPGVDPAPDDERVPLRSVAPTLLRLLDLPVPDSMEAAPVLR